MDEEKESYLSEGVSMAEKPDSPLTRAVRSLGTDIGRIEELLNILERKLGPITLPGRDEDSKSIAMENLAIDPSNPEMRSPIVKDIDRHNGRLRSVRRKIQVLIDRTEV